MTIFPLPGEYIETLAIELLRLPVPIYLVLSAKIYISNALGD